MMTMFCGLRETCSLCVSGTSGVRLPHYLHYRDLPEDLGLRSGDAPQLLHSQWLEPARLRHRHRRVRKLKNPWMCWFSALSVDVGSVFRHWVFLWMLVLSLDSSPTGFRCSIWMLVLFSHVVFCWYSGTGLFSECWFSLHMLVLS